MTCLAICYDAGAGVPVDFAKAIALFMRAAEAGDALAQLLLGERYRDGDRGVARDAAVARKWLARAAESGHEEAAAKLAMLDAAAPP